MTRVYDSELVLNKLNMLSSVALVEATLALYKSPNRESSGQLHWQLAPATLADSPLRSLAGAVEFSGTTEKLSIDGHINALGTEFTLNAHASLNAKSIPYSIALSWPQLDWPQQRPTLISQNGRLSLQGDSHGYQFTGETQLKRNAKNDKARKDIDGALAFAGAGNSKSLTLSKLDVDGPLGELHAQGEIHWQPPLSAQLSIEGKQLNPEPLLSQWPANINLSGTVDTSIEDNSPLFNITLSADGELRSYPLKLSSKGTFHRGQGKIALDTLSIGASRISSVFSFAGDSISGEWQIHSQDLQSLLPAMEGQFHSQGTLAGTLSEPQLKGKMQGSDIAFAAASLDQLDSHFDIDWQQTGANPSQLAIVINQVFINGQHFDRIDIHGKGLPANHTLSAKAESADRRLASTINGQWQFSQNQWIFTVNQALLATDLLGEWRLSKPLSGQIHKDKQVLQQHCWQQQTARICLGASNSREQSALAFTLNNLSSRGLGAFLPEAIAWQDTEFNGGGQARIVKSSQDAGVKDTRVEDVKLFADITLSSTPGQLIWQPRESKPTAAIALDTGQLRFQADAQQWRGSLNLPIKDLSKKTLNTSKTPGLEGQFSAVVGDSPVFEWPINAALAVFIDDIRPLTAFIPDAQAASGALQGQWSVNGSLKSPQLNGSIALKAGSLELLTPNLHLDNIEFALIGRPDGGLEFTGQTDSGGGTLRVQGKKNTGSETLWLSITGDKALVYNTIEASIYASPDLIVEADPRNITLRGQVTLPEARITPTELPSSVVQASSDQVIINDKPSSPSTRATAQTSIEADVDLILGEQVSIDGFGFKGNLNGSLRINKKASGATLGNGELRIQNGEYRALGQGLVIDQGKILFTGGPISTPGIDVKASRQPAEDITVGVFARGDIAEPELTLFSEPTMEQQEQLSWLVLGRSLANTSTGESNLLNQILLSVSLNRGDSFLDDVKENLYLDTVDIKTGSGEAGAASDNELAELVLGKYLSPGLYISYGIGLFKPINVLSLEYSLGQSWKLITESSAQASGGDVVYTIER
ncbi:MAG: translocation/assembly module TamB domain-containing protein [Pseudomonadota bacterium]